MVAVAALPTTAPELPLLELSEVRRSYGGHDGEPPVDVLRGVSFSIRAGEFVALVGASGSGKSTLMHILGCLDQPSSGHYRFAGKDVSTLDADQLAWLRREAFGFVFQGYHLIRTMTALHNVEVPAVYAGVGADERKRRATALLARLNLAERLDHRPSQLSGGQQQRVSIARALINGGHIILADEPTGALDSRSGAEVMSLLRELADAGHTIILITHDREVASQARRIIEIRDGQVIADSCNGNGSADDSGNAAPSADAGDIRKLPDLQAAMARGAVGAVSSLADMREALQAAWRVMWVNRFRTLLTLLGIVIGVASVIVMLAIGTGTQEKVLEKMASFGTNRMYVVPGGENGRGPGGILTETDARLVAGLPNIDVAMPYVQGNVTLRAGNVDTSAPLWAVTSDASRVLNWNTVRGVFFNAADERSLATVLLLGKKVSERLFGADNPVGKYVLVNNIPFLVIGELAEKGASSGDANDDDVVLTPYSTGSRRVLGTTRLSWISVLIRDLDKSEAAVDDIGAALEASHHVRDFRVYNRAAVVQAQNETQRTLTLMLGLIAAISLVVGGIGVMNIMLMTVKERIREIGIRMATGARQRDILRQFLTEAVMVSLIGGLAGVAIGVAIGSALLLWDVPIIFSVKAIGAAFLCALATGVVFGFMPARQAARLDPVIALAGE